MKILVISLIISIIGLLCLKSFISNAEAKTSILSNNSLSAKFPLQSQRISSVNKGKSKHYRTLIARITHYGHNEPWESKLGCRNNRLKRGDCAVPKGTLKYGSHIYIPETNKEYTVRDWIPNSSVEKLIGNNNIVIDIYRGKDLNCKEVLVYD